MQRKIIIIIKIIIKIILHYEFENSIYGEYFKFILQNIALPEPENWEEAENMYFRLMSIANDNAD